MSIPLDGNAIAGALGEIFAVDVTIAVAECAQCGSTGAVAEVLVYLDGPGAVGRCPACDAVLFRLVRGPNRAWLDLRGVVCLRLDLPDA
jgi:Family of unknown function (DUF6510)